MYKLDVASHPPDYLSKSYWLNFIDDYRRTINRYIWREDLRKYLKENGIALLEDDDSLVFESEEDATMFILKWS